MKEKGKLPRTEDVGALADFFDATDTQDLEWEDADVKFQRPELVHVSLRLPKEDLAAIKRAARRLGLGYTTYIRMVLRRAVER